MITDDRKRDIAIIFGNSPALTLSQLSLEQLEIFIDEYEERKRSISTPEVAPITSLISTSFSFQHEIIPEQLIDLHDVKKPSHSRSKVGRYQRVKNVFASPLKICFDYVAPIHKKTHEEVNFLYENLSGNFIFSGMSHQDISMLIQSMELVNGVKGDLIIQQGDIGDHFYLLHKGNVSFIIDGNVVGNASKGESFGELALLFDCPRAATVQADTDYEIFRVDQITFRSMLANNKAQISKENIDVLKKVPFLSHLGMPILTKLSDSLTTVTFNEGDIIVSKGDKGDHFYIIKKGKVLSKDLGQGESRYEDQILEEGAFFGQWALLTDGTRAATVVAQDDCVLFCVSKAEVEKLLGKFENIVTKAALRVGFTRIPAIASAGLNKNQIDQLANEIEIVSFEKGQVLSKIGDRIGSNKKFPQGLYFVKQGRISIVTRDSKVEVFKIGDYFGVMTFQAKHGDNSDQNIFASEDTLCRLITKKSFEDILGDINLLSKSKIQRASKLDTSITLGRLKKHTILGEGTFGQVWLVTDEVTNQPYALKIQNKKEVINKGQVKGVIREKNLMASVNHPFLIRLVNAFQDDSSLFMVQNLIQGGELFNVIHTATRDGISENAAKFYASCILEGLSHMHHQHIVYRDLKPENVLIDRQGYCVLIDLGFAKVVTDKTYTLCGTPLYLAPEILLNRGYNKGVDFWSFGCIIYEMLLGRSPFYKDGIDQKQLFKRIVRSQYSFPCWSERKDAARDIITNLLVLKPAHRLGVLAGEDEDIRAHIWFRNIHFGDLLSKSLAAPWLPTIENPLDTSNFENWNHLADKEDLVQEPLLDREQKLFLGF